ncbi:MAG: tRNA 2-thiouridine(34) synthase MnmA, partial [Patescibacteria group bacterium]
VMCNKHIKFGLFLDKALKEGADFIATGHYVRIRPTTNNQQPTTPNKKSKKSSVVGCKLLVAADKNKDQSYFLWTLTQDQLKYCLFPIGDYTKPQVRKLAKKFGLPTANKKDSQGVCFIGPLNIKDFLTKYIKPKKGKILDTKGNFIGHHDGVSYYTIGQRHGLDIKNGQGPYFVVRKDIKKNIIYVGGEQELRGQTAKVTDLNWISDKPKPSTKISIKIRYRSGSVPARLTIHYPLSTIHFLKQVRAITPGQSAVFYRGQELLGGGIITGFSQ